MHYLLYVQTHFISFILSSVTDLPNLADRCHSLFFKTNRGHLNHNGNWNTYSNTLKIWRFCRHWGEQNRFKIHVIGPCRSERSSVVRCKHCIGGQTIPSNTYGSLPKTNTDWFPRFLKLHTMRVRWSSSDSRQAGEIGYWCCGWERQLICNFSMDRRMISGIVYWRTFGEIQTTRRRLSPLPRIPRKSESSDHGTIDPKGATLKYHCSCLDAKPWWYWMSQF